MDERTQKILSVVIIITLFIIVTVAAFAYEAAEIKTFEPDGKYLGDFKLGNNWYNIFHIVFGPSVDEAWVTTNSFFQYLIFPFAAIWLVMFGIFSEITFFRRITWFNGVIALIVSLVVSSTGVLVRMMRGYMVMAGGMGILFFGFILFLGILFWFIGRLGRFGRYGIPLPGAVTSIREVGTIEATLQHYRKWANRIQDSGDARTALQIRTLIGQADTDLDKSPPDTNAARDKISRMENIVNEFRRRTRT